MGDWPAFSFARLARSGSPGTIDVFGMQAHALVTSPPPDSAAVVVAARTELGRVVAIAHEGYLAHPATLAGGPQLWEQAVEWAARAVVREAQPPYRIGCVGKKEAWLAERIAELGLTHKFIPAPWDSGDVNAIVWIGETGSGDVVARDADIMATKYGRLATFVESGGGLVVGMCPWGFEQITGRKAKDESAQNHVLLRYGMAFTNRCAGGHGDFDLTQTNAQAVHAGEALAAILRACHAGQRPSDADVGVLEGALRSLPLGRPEATPVADAVQSLIRAYDPNALFAGGSALKRDQVIQRLQVTWFTLRWKALPPEHVPAAPNVQPCDGPRETAYLSLDCAVDGWHSTGLYVPPGVAVTIECLGPHEGWSARIGCHTDELWHQAEWKRWPEVTSKIDLTSPLTRVASPFGGLLYFEGHGKHQTIDVQVSNAVRAPWFDVQAMTEADWAFARQHAAPWAELGGKHVIVTVPSTSVRELDHPKEVTDFWDSVVACHCELKYCPPPKRRERLVVDVQISAGYMHSGYPIMMHLDQAPLHSDKHATLVDVRALHKDGNWGIFHELGHNQQVGSWTFDGTVEVTCNLFTLFTMERLCGIRPWTHPWLQPQKKTAREYLQHPSFSKWKGDPGLALVSYALIQNQFGWDCIAGAMAGCAQDVRNDASSQQKMDMWVKRLSLCTGRNLCAYYQSWGMPLTALVLEDAEVKALPQWDEGAVVFERAEQLLQQQGP